MSGSNRPVVVFDCMVLLQATASPTGPSAACLKLVEDGRMQLRVSRQILAEVRAVLSRPKVRSRNPKLDEKYVEAYLAHIAEVAPTVTDVPRTFAYSRDPLDEPYINLAISQNANFLLSFDNDLLDLMKEGNADGEALKAQAPDLIIITPPELLQILRAMP